MSLNAKQIQNKEYYDKYERLKLIKIKIIYIYNNIFAYKEKCSYWKKIFKKNTTII